MRLKRKIGCLLLLLGMFLLVPLQQVSAHATLLSMTPEDGSGLAEFPDTVQLTFSEAVEPDFPTIMVKNSVGERVDDGQTKMGRDPRTISVKLKSNFADAADVYSVSWRIVSADGHPVSGTNAFKVGDAKQSLPESSIVKQPISVNLASSIGKFMLYSGFVMAAGWLLLLVMRQRIKTPLDQFAERSTRWLFVAMSLLLLGEILSIWVHTAIILDLPLKSALLPNKMGSVIIETTTGHLWLMSLLGISGFWLVGWFWLKYGKPRLNGALFLMMACLFFVMLLKAMSGHAKAASDPVIAITADFLHIVAASVWIGGILALLYFTRKAGKVYWSRFSYVAMGAVALLLMTGLLLGVLNLGEMKNLFTTSYGYVLLLKLGLIICMGLLGLFHYLYIQQKQKPLPIKTIVLENIIGLLILLTAAFLTNQPLPPPKAPEPFQETLATEQNEGFVQLKVTPRIVGENQFMVTFTDAEQQPLSNFEKVTIHFERQDDKADVVMEKSSEGAYTASGLYFNQKGTWRLTVKGLTKDYTTIEQTFDVKVE
ncbi:copper resistance CopC/CopD family protein [Listeria costaricensis]|uniref:copper resistance CopC/CopD family protein n=1 Tax=Listeria costaricensis TaxID=2026604 RepID=UPI000C0792D8|nr:copper resistance CopC/CopD family protein [Listeria costaricensis]